jgi:signal peptidase I
MGSIEFDPTTIARATRALVNERLRAGKTACFVISTSSMLPALAPGDKVFVRAARVDELRMGDIVIRSFAGALIAHRFIGRAASGNADELMTKGDNTLIADDPWQSAQLVGSVIAMERAGRKKAASFARARLGGFAVALLSRSQLSANLIRPKILRRIAMKSLRASLTIAARIAL